MTCRNVPRGLSLHQKPDNVLTSLKSGCPFIHSFTLLQAPPPRSAAGLSAGSWTDHRSRPQTLDGGILQLRPRREKCNSHGCHARFKEDSSRFFYLFIFFVASDNCKSFCLACGKHVENIHQEITFKWGNFIRASSWVNKKGENKRIAFWNSPILSLCWTFRLPGPAFFSMQQPGGRS